MKKKIGLITIGLLIVVSIFGYKYYNAIMSPNTGFSDEIKTINIPTNSDYNQLVDLLGQNNIIKNIESFRTTSKLMKYDQAKIKSGRYAIESGWSNRQIIQKLRLGKQTPVKLKFNNARTIDILAGKISKQLEMDSIHLFEYLTSDEVYTKYDVNADDVLTLFTPNTYEVYWNTTDKDLVEKLKKESDRFWKNKDRLNKAKKNGFNKKQVYTLASIVEKETQANVEKARIAGVYINRIKRGIPLQADPTVVFAHKKFDLKRVLLKHLEIDSPYNTYKYGGLPPGPIFMPSISSIDAVLNYEKHNLLYFCAKPDGSGQHAFAKSLVEHNNNARKYQRWLNKNKIN